MSWQAGLMLFGGLALLLLLSGQWVAVALGAAGIIGLFLVDGARSVRVVASISWGSMNSLELAAVPLFLFMGELLMRTGLSRRFYQGAAVWLARAPGGLLHTNIVTSIVVSAVCGSTSATAATVGTVAIPELMRRGYDRRMIFGTLGAGSLGLLIPPSIAMIVYGALVGESVPKLFLAGVLPGVLCGAIFVFYTIVVAMMWPKMSPREVETVTWAKILWALLDMLPMLGVMVAIWAGMFSGFMTPNEIAAVGVLLTLLISAVFREMTPSGIVDALASTVRITSGLLFIVIGAQVFAHLLVITNVSRELAESLISYNLGPGTLFIVIVALYVLLGCFFDGFSMMFLTLPVLYPVIVRAGFDPIWFGVVLILLIEIGQQTPPVGFEMFVYQAIAPDVALKDILLGMLPYTLLMMLVVVALWFWPALALWLPGR